MVSSSCNIKVLRANVLMLFKILFKPYLKPKGMNLSIQQWVNRADWVLEI